MTYPASSYLGLLALLVCLSGCGGGGGGDGDGGGGGGGSAVTSVALQETGQTACFDGTGSVIDCAGTGQDGDLRAGVAWPNPRFTVGAGATADCVTDNLTSLVWVRAPSATTASWAAALTTANNLTLCGFSDWRLPNANELESLINNGVADSGAYLNTQGFSGVQTGGGGWWSSTSFAGNAALAWPVDMRGGWVAQNKGIPFLVWPVRAGLPTAPAALPQTGQTTCTNATGSVVPCVGTGQDGDLRAGVAWPNPRFTVGTGATVDCVTDNLTGLMWVRAPSTTPTNWAGALTIANNLTLCGFSDWRLPNQKELRSLNNYELVDNAVSLNSLGFSNVQTGFSWYWSSSSFASNATYAWNVSVATGSVSWEAKSASHFVWPVRGGQ